MIVINPCATNQATPGEGPWHSHWPMGLILIAFIALGLTYNVINPIFEAPDEVQHFYYVKHIADGNGLPVQGEEGQFTWEQEGSQPPLYYLLGAALIAGVDTSDAEQVIWYNPQANLGTPHYPGNKNRIVHTDREEFPYHDTTQAVHILRFFSLVLGAGTVLFTYLIGLEVIRRRGLALLAAMFVAFNPQFVFISSAVSNDSLVIFFSTVALWLLIRLLASQKPTRLVIPLGIILGLAALSKLSGLALLSLTVIVLGLIWWRRRSWNEVFKIGGVICLFWIAVAGWWYARNWILYHDLTGLAPMLEIMGRRNELPSIQEMWGEFRGLRFSFWALFGWFNTLAPQIIYHVLDILVLLAGLGLIIGLVRRKRWGVPIRVWPAGLLVVWCVVVFISLIRWSIHTLGSQGRLLFPAISAFMI